MQKSVHPLVVLGVALFFGGILAGWFWSNQQSLNLDRLLMIKVSPKKELVVQLGNYLYFSDLDGRPLKTLALADLGVDRFVGDFAFFNNGDVLLSRRGHSLSAADVVAANLRLPADERKSEDARLHRCSLSSLRCQEFSKELPDFFRSFKLYIDPLTDQVYIADTSRHQLRLIDAKGKQLAQAKGFKFPNQLLVHKDALWLADTNHHQIKRLEPESAFFGNPRDYYEARLGKHHIWPFAIAPVADTWWVLIADNGMNNARAVVYSSDWQQSRTLKLPADADPLAMLVLEDRVLMTDNRLFRIYQFDLEGNPLPDFVPEALAERLFELQRQAGFWKMTGRAMIGLFVMALAVGFAFGVRQHLEDKKAEVEQTLATPVPELPANGIWIEADPRVRWLAYAHLIGIPLVLLAVTLLGIPFRANEFLVKTQLFMAGVLVALMFGASPMLRLSQYKLGLFRDRLELRMGAGKREVCKYEDILWNKRAVKLGQQVITFGQSANISIFHHDTLKKYLAPRLLPQNYINERAMARYQWHSHEGAMKVAVAMLVVLAVSALMLHLEEILNWFN